MKISEFLKDKNNKFSMMRLGIFIGLLCAAYLIIGGGITFFTGITGAEAMAIGAGLFPVLLGGKALQSRTE